MRFLLLRAMPLMALLLFIGGCQAFSDYAGLAADLTGSLTKNPDFLNALGDAVGSRFPTEKVALWSGVASAALRLASKLTAEKKLLAP